MDFVSDQLFDGRKFRALSLVDNFSRQCMAIRVGQSIRGIDVVRIMEELKTEYKIIPERIQVANGSEFISKDFDRWANENKVILDYSRPGKPTDNPFIESFNGREEYNSFRPHSSLNDLTPNQVIEMYKKSPDSTF